MNAKLKTKPTKRPQPISTGCLTDGCTCKATCRGLCAKCYSAAGKAVRAKLVTWEQLIAWGMATEPHRANGRNLFLRLLEKRVIASNQAAARAARRSRKTIRS